MKGSNDSQIVLYGILEVLRSLLKISQVPCSHGKETSLKK